MDHLAFRVGAASLLFLVGATMGMVAALALLAVNKGNATPIATIIFGSGGVSAAFAAAFPSTALASVSSVAHFFWGLISLLLGTEATSPTEQGATASEKWLFWLGVAISLALYVAVSL